MLVQTYKLNIGENQETRARSQEVGDKITLYDVHSCFSKNYLDSCILTLGSVQRTYFYYCCYFIEFI